MSIEDRLTNPLRMYNGIGRAVIVTHSYTGNGNGDPNGYYYHYEDAPNVRHWISAGAIRIRFSESWPVATTHEEALVLRSQMTGKRREDTVAAAMRGINAVAAELGAVSIITTPKGFCVVYANDDRMYFDGLEI